MDIQEVARLANVSTATVSRVINNSPSVRPSTSEHVRRIVALTNYVPNRSARNLRVRHSKLFGLIVSDVRNPFFPELIDGFDALATAHGIDVIFTHTNYDPKRLEHCLRRMVERNVDGIAVMTSETEPAALARVARLKVPMVLLDQAASGFHSITTDFDSGYDEAVLHLKQLGHVDIGFISGPAGFDSVRRRHKAFLASLKRHRLAMRKEWIATGDLQVGGGRAAMEQLLARGSRPTAVLAANDLMAVGAIHAAQDAGLDVPRELSVIGFDDLPSSLLVNPPLTTICLSRQEIASQAFRFLLQSAGAGVVAESEASSRGSAIRPKLVVRESTASPLGPSGQLHRRRQANPRNDRNGARGVDSGVKAR